MKRFLVDKRGVTLIELVVALIIFAIMALAVTFVLVPTLKTYEAANELAELNTIVNTVGMEISSELSRATISPTITPPAISNPAISGGESGEIQFNVSANNVITYTVDSTEGILLKQLNDGEKSPPLSKSFYRGKKIKVTYEITDLDLQGIDRTGEAYLINVGLSGSGGNPLMTREFAVNPMVLNQI